MRQFTACIAASALALGAASIALPAYAADDIGSNPITEFFDGLGLGSKEKPEIAYRDRAPLVPPSNVSALPPPVPGAANRDANGEWPKDPDVQRRAEAKARNDLLPTETYNYRMEKNSRISPSELQGRRTAGGGAVTEPGGTVGDNHNDRLSPSELRNQRLDRGAIAAAVPSGPRNRLSDPPAGYLSGSEVTAEVKPEKPWYGKLFSGN